MSIRIIPAEPNHAPQIATVIRLSFEEESNAQTIASIIKAGIHHTWVAIVDDTVVGFVDGFLTKDIGKVSRAELDLLAVHPDYQGQGIGKQLILMFTQSSAIQSADYIRTLIRFDNTPMQHAISQYGYMSDTKPHTLYIGVSQADEVDLPEHSHTVAVSTFTYSGVWLEGNISEKAIYHAQNQRDEKALEIVGTVVDKAAIETISLLQQHQFEAVNDYHWWFNALD